VVVHTEEGGLRVGGWPGLHSPVFKQNKTSNKTKQNKNK
jgi:hypothetical protein